MRIGAKRESLLVQLREIWAYRDLLYFLSLREIKIRYKQTVLGASWAILQPLLATAVFTLFFGRLANMPSDGIPYPAYVFSAMTLWTFFANAITNGGNSLVGNSNLITKVYFPRVIVPAAAVASGLVDFSIAFVLLIFVNLYFRCHFSVSILVVPLVVLVTTALATGLGLWMAALNVRFRDVRYALPFLIQLWMFATPIIYPPSLVPERWRWLVAINPMAGLIEAFRSALFSRPFDWTTIGVSAATTVVVLAFVTRSFRSMEVHFADLV